MTLDHELRKVVEWTILLDVREDARRKSQVFVWTNGCFDLLHFGHVRGLQAAAQLGDILVVGVNSDHSVQTLKGPDRPIVPETERVAMLAALQCVDYVVVFEELTPETAIRRLKPDIHCKGSEYAEGNRPLPEADIVSEYGGRIEFLPRVPATSTSEILRRIRGKDD